MGMIRVLGFMILLLAPMGVQGAELSGNYMIHVCGMDAAGKELVKGGHTTCQAYIAGVVDYYELMRTLDIGAPVDYCIPEGTTLYDMQVVVLRYLVTHRSQHGSFTAAPAVMLALYRAWPCEKKGKKR